jgi:hypothetical protein
MAVPVVAKRLWNSAMARIECSAGGTGKKINAREILFENKMIFVSLQILVLSDEGGTSMKTDHELELRCWDGPCADISQEYQQDTVDLQIILFDSLHTSKAKPFPVSTTEIRVVSKDDGHVLNMTSERINPETGEHEFNYKASPAAFYEIIVTFGRQNIPNISVAQTYRIVQVIPGQSGAGVANNDYSVRFDLQDANKHRKIEILDANKEPLAVNGATYIGLFDQAVEKDPAPSERFNPEKDPMLNEEDEKHNYIGSDSRRFYIKVIDKEPLFVKTVNGRRYIEVDWITEALSGAIADDNLGQTAKRVSLEESKEELGTFLSRGLMVTSQARDVRQLTTHCGFGDMYPTDQLKRKRGQSDFRMRHGGLFGNVRVSYPVENLNRVHQRLHAVVRTFPKNEIRYLPIQIFLFNNMPVTPFAMTAATSYLMTVLNKTREVLSPLGIYPYTVRHPVPEANIKNRTGTATLIQHPVDKRDFAYLISTSTVRRQNGDPVDMHDFVSNDALLTANVYPRTGNTIRAFFVGKMAPLGTGPNAVRQGGFAHDDTGYGNSPLGGSLFSIHDTDPGGALTAHELSHLLTNKSTSFGHVADPTIPTFNPGGGHYQRPGSPENNRYRHFYNLMGSQIRFRLWDVDVLEDISQPTYKGHINPNFPAGQPPNPPRKMLFNQYKDMRGSHHTHDLETYLKNTKSSTLSFP